MSDDKVPQHSEGRDANRSGLGLLGVGAAACAACCAGPILGVLTALSLATVTGVVLFGGVGLIIAVAGALWFRHRQRRQSSCGTSSSTTLVHAPTRRQS